MSESFLTVEQKQEFIKSNGSHCPRCKEYLYSYGSGSGVLYSVPEKEGSGIIHEEVHCFNCSMSWKKQSKPPSWSLFVVLQVLGSRR